jgi:hypothetical protein
MWSTLTGSCATAIAGYDRANMTALRAKAGVWDQGTRIDMLLLRMFCMFASSPVEVPFYRAVCLSLEAVTVPRGAGGPALSKWHAVNRLPHQQWGQQLLAAADRLGVTLSVPPVPPVAQAARIPRAPSLVLNPAVPHVVVNRVALQQRAAAGPVRVGAAPPPVHAGVPAFCGLSARGVVLLQADLLGDRSFTVVRGGDAVPAHVALRLVVPGVVPPARYVEA